MASLFGVDNITAIVLRLIGLLFVTALASFIVRLYQVRMHFRNAARKHGAVRSCP